MKIKVTINNKHPKLINACVLGDLAVVQALLDDGLHLSQLITADDEPLFIAICNNNVPLVRLLLDNGLPTHCNTKELYGYRPQKEIQGMQLYAKWKPEWHEACLAVLEYTAVADTREYASSYNGFRCLSYLEYEQIGVKSDAYFNALVAKGLSVDVRNEYGDPLLNNIFDVDNKYVLAIIALSRNINAYKVDPEKGTEFPLETPLYRALSSASISVINALLEKGANPNAYSFRMNESILDYVMGEIETYTEYQQMDEMTFWQIRADLLCKHGAKTYQQLVVDGDIKE